MILQINVGGLDFPIGNPNTNYTVTLRLANEPCPPASTGIQTKDHSTWGDYFDALTGYIAMIVSRWGNSRLTNAKPDEYDGGQKPGYQGMIEVYLDDAFFDRNVGFCEGGIVLCPYASPNPKFQPTIPMEFVYLESADYTIPGKFSTSPQTTDPNVRPPNSTKFFYSKVSTSPQTTDPNVRPPNNTNPFYNTDSSVTVSPAPISFSGDEGVNWENRRMVITTQQTPGYLQDGAFMDTFPPNQVIGYADGIETITDESGRPVKDVMRVRTFQNKVLFYVDADHVLLN